MAITITLPDGSKKSFDQALSVAEIAIDIGAGLAKAAIAGKVADKLVDLDFIVTEDASVEIITADSPEGLDVIRHSAAHLLAQAVTELFPKAQPTIGPVVENGFYYDFDYEAGFTETDLEKIEKRMHELAKQDLPIKRETKSRKEALKFYKKRKEKYKLAIIKELPEKAEISFYSQGNFIDLCRGPHLPSTARLEAFKVTKLAGAYWRGDQNNAMLQRIYGTAWANKKQLKQYLHLLEEAKKNDHRLLGKKMDLFHFQENAPGMAFWHAKGWTIYQEVVQYMRRALCKYDYQEISAPIILDRSLWETSGHWEKFAEHMFITSSEERLLAVKPMNCPGHLQIYNQGLKSYRDLPLRMAEFGMCHRNEFSGTLHGLMRIRQFLMDDAHVFCTEDQLLSEVNTLIDFIFEVYKDFGFTDILVRLATRPEKRIGSDAEWTMAEEALTTALNNRDIPWDPASGEGAFYGPKIEFQLRDCLGRTWQCGTIQVDFAMPARMAAKYVAEDGSRKTPVMVHRAILGSIERFIGILIEHYAGKLPLWLAPVQVAVLNITAKQADYAQKVTARLKKLGFRVISDLRNEKIGFKIREHTIERVPFFVIVGDREVAKEKITVRNQVGEDLGSMSLEEFTAKLRAERKT